jgi:hypothetical protein
LISQIRIVLAFGARLGALNSTKAAHYLARVNDVHERAEVLGARLCASGADFVAFDFSAEEVEEAISLARYESSAEAKTLRFGMGLADGEMTALDERSAAVAVPSSGRPLVKALALARMARAGELLVDPQMIAVKQREILTRGVRSAKEGARRVKALLVDWRQPLRRELVENNLEELVRPRLSGRREELEQLLGASGPVSVIRAPGGHGGTRLLEEIEVALAPARSLYLVTAGAEPLGSLRRALGRAVLCGSETMSRWPDIEQHAMLRLLSGEGVTLSTAADLVARSVTGAVLIDDVMEVDDPSLEAVARALRRQPGLRCYVRFGDDAPLPRCFADLARGPEVHLAALSRADTDELVVSLTSGRLSAEEARRWTLRGLCLPLGAVEAVLESAVSGELSLETGSHEASTTRQRFEPEVWIARRLRLLSPRTRRVLHGVAVLGMETSAAMLQELLRITGMTNADEFTADAVRSRWLRAHPDGTYALVSRTHRDVLLAEMDEEEKLTLHGAAFTLVERLGGKLASAEAARHAALGGDQERAVLLALAAARASHVLGLSAATEALLSFADSDPSELGPIKSVLRVDSWIETLRASGARDGAVGRLDAIAKLAQGHTQEAVERLEDALERARGAPPAARSRAWLAYAIALAVAGRPTEALLAGLEALAGARESGESGGEQACARFLARLSQGAGHAQAALLWQGIVAEARREHPDAT